MNFNPRTPRGRAGQAAILLYRARLSPELLDLPAFTELFQEHAARTSMELARRIAQNKDLAAAVLGAALKPRMDPLWIRAARAASENLPMLFPEYEDSEDDETEVPASPRSA